MTVDGTEGCGAPVEGPSATDIVELVGVVLVVVDAGAAMTPRSSDSGPGLGGTVVICAAAPDGWIRCGVPTGASSSDATIRSAAATTAPARHKVAHRRRAATALRRLATTFVIALPLPRPRCSRLAPRSATGDSTHRPDARS
jgi:hypothetical protein